MKSVGRYDILEKLGQGGMGTVYKAFDPLLTRLVAIKVISGQLDSLPEHRDRFFREARAAAQLSHRNIITIHDLGEHEGLPFLAMEYLEGRDLDRRLHDREPMSRSQKVELAMGIAEGLCHAHACGIVHRDVKPANVFVTNDGGVKILDFGLARLVTSDMTRTGLVVGTVNYMAPEQLRGEKSDHRADIFAFGVLFYELLAGHRPFQGDSAASTMYKILHEEPEPLALVDPTLPATLTTLVERAMAKSRDDRYQHMTDLLRDLDAAVEFVSGSTRRLQNRTVSVSRPISDPLDVTRVVPPLDDPQAASDETVPVSDAWRLAESNVVPPGWQLAPESMAAHPPADVASAPPPAVASTPPPTASSSARVMALGAIGLLAALAAIGIYSWRRPVPGVGEQVGSPAPQQSTAPASPAPAEVAAAPAPQPAPAPAPAAPAPAPPPPPPAPAPRPTDRDRDRERATQQARQATLEAERQRATAARTAVEAAKAAAVAAGAPELAAPLYSSAERQEALARDDFRQERYAAAASRLDATVSLYRSAESAAQSEAETRASRARQQNEDRKRDEAARAIPPPPAPRPEPPARPEPPTPPPAPPGPSAQEQIAAVVERYRAALEQRSLPALKAVWPGLSGAQQSAIEGEFANARSIEVQLVNPRIQLTGASATVVTRRQYRLRTRDGQQLSSESVTTITLRQAGSAWVIDSVRYQPVN